MNVSEATNKDEIDTVFMRSSDRSKNNIFDATMPIAFGLDSYKNGKPASIP